jgi:hypothetical protein
MMKTMVAVSMLVVAAFATGCTVTFPENGRPLTVSPQANPGARESLPQTQGRALAYDDRNPSAAPR